MGCSQEGFGIEKLGRGRTGRREVIRSGIKERETDGGHSQKDITFNGPDPITEPGAYVVPEVEVDAGDERVGRPRRLAKPTTRPSEYLYF